MKQIIFTDLDGTLLDHHDYSFDEAKEMLSFIQNSQIPLIFTTSKTKKECQILQQKMGIDSPFIVENGAAIFDLESGVVELGVSYKTLREFIKRYAKKFNLKPFSLMSVDEVMEATGFSDEMATLAKEREYSEPFLCGDENGLEEFKEIAEDAGFKVLRGGRFYHLVGDRQDKGEAVKLVLKHYRGYKSIALGDNYNDLDMLRVVDTPVLIPRFDSSYIEADIDTLKRAPFPGPKGWNLVLKEILNV